MGKIEIRDLSFRYGQSEQHAVLKNLCAEFDSSRITVLTGPSGCGKSTLLYLAAGLYPENAGTVFGGSVTVEGEALASLPPHRRCALAGMMFQNPELQFCMDTVENELIFCLENAQVPPADISARMDEALDFSGISHLRSRALVTLSGGEKQKAMLACLTALRPKWLLLDEPFANIDEASARFLAQKFRAMHERFGTGILAVDHRLDNWAEAADDLCLFDGQNGSISPPLPLKELDGARFTQLGVIGPNSPYRENPPAPAPLSPDEPPVLELKNLSLSHGKTPVLQKVNARFSPGRIYAILGESGSGKSSLFGALSGLYPYEGSVFLEGKDLRRSRRRALGKLGFVTQDPQDQFVGDRVLDELLISLKSAQRTGALSKETDIEAEAERILKSIGLWRYRRRSPYLLSQGQQRRLGVAALLAYPCRALFCDEPTYAQDRVNTVALMESLCRIAREQHIALIFSTHDRRLAVEYADALFELKGGALHALDQSRL